METESGAEFISETHVRHVMRYVRAMELIRSGQTHVLDAACGTGYGTAILAKKYQVMGLDSSEAALLEARFNYPHMKFEREDLIEFTGRIKFIFSCIVSIETIEHFSIEQIPDYLRSIKRMLRKNGQFIVSTPYCAESGPSPITKQHLWEFSLTDLEIVLVGGGFDVKAIYPERHEGKAGRLGYCMVDCVAR